MKRFFLKLFLKSLDCFPCKEDKKAREGYAPRILIIRRNRMGDMICALPMIRQLRKNHPQAWIRVLCDRPGEVVALASGLVDEVVVMEHGLGRYGDVIENRQFVKGFDYVFGVKVGFDTLAASLVYLSGASRRLGFVPEGDDEIKEGFFYTDPVEIPRVNEHQAVSCMRLLLPLSIPEGPYDFRIQVPAVHEDFAREKIEGFGFREKHFCIVSVSTNQEDRWSLESFSALCQCLKSQFQLDTILTGVSGDRALARDCMKLCGDQDKYVHLVETPTTLHLAALISKARLVVAFEGGVAHLATACDVPGVILWRVDAPFEKWKALSSKNRYVRGNPVSEISVSEVLHAIGSVIEDNPVQNK